MKKLSSILIALLSVAAITAIAAMIAGCERNPGGGDKFAMYTLTTGVTPANCGTVEREPHATTYQNGTEVTLTAKPAVGYLFAGWSDSSALQTNPQMLLINPLTIAMTRNTTLTAHFEPIPENHYSLTVTTDPPATGTISREPNLTSYAAGTEVVVTVVPAEGYTLDGWSGTASSKDSVVRVTMNSNLTLTAILLPLHTLSIDINPIVGGTVERDPNRTSYADGTQVALTAKPNPGYEFIGWTGTLTSEKAVDTITMGRDQTLTANFQPITYKLLINISPPGSGTVTRAPDLAGYPFGTETQVTLTAKSADGYVFDSWTEADMPIGTIYTTTIAVSSDRTLTANFKRLTYPLAIHISPPMAGEVTLNPSGGNYEPGTPVTATATAADHYAFVKWEGVSTSTSNPVTITMPSGENTTLTAIFQLTGTPPDNFFTDARDQKVYRTVVIGSQTWMAENLNYAGPDVSISIGVCYENKPDNCVKYGRLYDWATVMGNDSSSSLSPSGVQGICPAGWHVPSDAEWDTLVMFVDPDFVAYGDNVAGVKLKAASGWNTGPSYVPGTDDYGFSALPGGDGTNNGSSFGLVGAQGRWWSATEAAGNDDNAWSRSMARDESSVFRGNASNARNMYSVRCVKD